MIRVRGNKGGRENRRDKKKSSTIFGSEGKCAELRVLFMSHFPTAL